MGYGFRIIVEGDNACFTRPELKVERVSYDVPTPCALEGMIKSVYWKPSIRYRIDKIVVFNPVRFMNIRRNEVKEKIKMSAVTSAMKGKGGSPELFINSEMISQRSGMVLRDVRYGVEFHFELTGLRNEHEDECEEKHYNILLRRLRQGQCFRQPVLGCREFAVKSIRLVESFPFEQISPELEGDTDLGFMLYGMKYADNSMPVNGNWDDPVFSDKADPVFYRPHMIDGVIDVAAYRRDLKC